MWTIMTRFVLAFLSVMLGSGAASAQVGVQLLSMQFGSVHGLAYDSLLMQPMAGVQVQIIGTGVMTKTNDRGRFTFDRVPVGKRQVAIASVELDSLGFGIIGTEVDVVADKSVDVVVAPLSLQTIWRRSCYSGNTIGRDSGVVWGTVRDAATGKASSAAEVSFGWYDLRPGAMPGLMISEVQQSASTNADGVYFACGLPTHVAIASTGLSDSSASGRIEFELGDRQLQRLDLTLSTDMVVASSVPYKTADDSIHAERLSGTATLRGRVLDDRQRPMTNAIVGIVATDSLTRTDASGQFTLRNLPAGTHNLSVRRVGSSPILQTVQLRPSSINEVVVLMSSVPVLTSVNVHAEVKKSQLRIEYEQRRKSALGRAIDGSVLEKRADLYSVFRDFPHMAVDRQGFGLSIDIKSFFGGRTCRPTAYLDGFPVAMDLASSLPTDMYRAVEIYENPFTVPAEYVTRSVCGVVLFWTKRIAW